MPRVEIDDSIILKQDKKELALIIGAYQCDHSGLQDILRHSLYYMFEHKKEIKRLSVSFVEMVFKAFVSSIESRVADGGEFRISWFINDLSQLITLFDEETFEFNVSSFEVMLEKMIQVNCISITENSFEKLISNALYSLGVLAETGNLSDQCLRGEIIEQCIAQLVNPTTTDFSKSLHGLSKLAKEGFLQRNSIRYVDITNLLEKITISNNYPCKDLSLSLYSIGILGKNDALTGYSAVNLFSNILDKLISLNPSARDISISLYGLGLLATSGFLIGRVGSFDVSKELFKRLLSTRTRTIDAQEISNSLYGVGLLCINHCFEERSLATGLLSELISDLLLGEAINMKVRHLSNSLYALGLINQTRKNIRNFDMDCTIIPLIRKIQRLSPSDSDYCQSMQGAIYCGYSPTRQEVSSLLDTKRENGNTRQQKEIDKRLKSEFADADIIQMEKLIGAFFVDIYMEFTGHGLKYVVESDGSHHREHEQESKDKIRDNWLVQQGYKVLRCSNDNSIEVNVSFLVDAIKQDISDAIRISKKRKLLRGDEFLSGDVPVTSNVHSESWAPDFFSKKGRECSGSCDRDDLLLGQSMIKNL